MDKNLCLIDHHGRFVGFHHRVVEEYPDAEKFALLGNAKKAARDTAIRRGGPVNIISDYGMETERIVDTIQGWSPV